MPQWSRSIIAYGSEQPLPERRLLRAGPLTAVLEGADLRYIRWGEHEVLRRVYVAVRDHNWGTVPATLSNLRVDAGEDTFSVGFDARHSEGGIDFAWRGTIVGREDGTISYLMDGRAHSTFMRNRIGICVLHPMACAGLPCRVLHSDGTVEAGEFPRLIAPHQPFRAVEAIAHAPAPGVEVEVRLAGDVFEMEDQRNWSDASFKTYSTPLELPFPVQVEQGTAVRQSLELALRDSRAIAPPTRHARPSGDAALSFTLLPGTSKLPRIGLCLNPGELPAGRELEQLRALNVAHLRLELDLADPDAAEQLRRAAGLGLPLLVAVFAGDDAARGLTRLRDALKGQALPIAAWLVFDKQRKVTAARTAQLARATLAEIAPGAALGGGTNAYFTELNRDHPPSELLDLVCYSLNPQVHGFDNATLVENLAAQAATVESARQLFGERPLAIGPVTLRPRFNPDATGLQPEPAPGSLPPEVDPRQMSLLGAGWTVGSLKYLSQAGAASITYYQVSGRRGVMEAGGGPADAAFPSRPGMVFPLYHVLADVGELATARVVHSQSSDPLAVDGLALRDGGRLRVVLANLGAREREVSLGLLDGDTVFVRLLDQHSFDTATRDGAAFRSRRGEQHALEGGTLRLRLPPYAVATIDGE